MNLSSVEVKVHKEDSTTLISFTSIESLPFSCLFLKVLKFHCMYDHRCFIPYDLVPILFHVSKIFFGILSILPINGRYT